MFFQYSHIKNDFVNKLSEEQKIIFLYRYVSLFITSLFYFIGPVNHTIGTKFFVIVCISTSSIILSYLYIKSKDDSNIITLLVLIETLGNSILLIPSGGLNSPYLWYALNTILITAVLQNRKNCCLNLFIYLAASTWIMLSFFNEKHEKLINLIKQQSNLIMSFVLITIAILLLVKYINEIKYERCKLMMINRELQLKNYQVKESINHIMELYQSVQLLSSLKEKEDLIMMILEHTKNITKTSTVMFYDLLNHDKELIVDGDELSTDQKDMIKPKILKMWDEILFSNSPAEIDISDKKYLMMSVRSEYMTYGILGIEITNNDERLADIGNIEQLVFLSKLSSMALERFELEQVNERLLIKEEQNRIANEIHDSILQRLFSTSFAIYGLMKKLNKVTLQDIHSELNMIRGAIDNSMKELRSAIYGLSWKKGGTDDFVVDTLNYINEIRSLNNMRIEVNMLGNSEVLSVQHKKALYRIICEGIGNAVRHGKATYIEVNLQMQTEHITLEIIDDGVGFDPIAINEEKKYGLGIKNINYLVHSLRGKIDYQSTVGKGSKIAVAIPNNVSDVREEKAV